MKILYVAKHNSGDNDDEGAIAYALEKLGHTVTCVHELRKYRLSWQQPDLLQKDHDICLFHKWPNTDEVNRITIPKVFWYFDLLHFQQDEVLLVSKSLERQRWLRAILPGCLLGFCTDGTFVDEDITGKLRWLMQGFDERLIPCKNIAQGNFGTQLVKDILFTGTRNHGEKRRKHIEHLEQKWKTKFHTLGESGPRYRQHGQNLADTFAHTKVIIAPEGPSTHKYWSNRIYNTLGLGGNILHPYCKGLAEQYNNLHFYSSVGHLDDLLDQLLYDLTALENFYKVNSQCREQTISHHLYRHRCEQLITEVQKELSK